MAASARLFQSTPLREGRLSSSAWRCSSMGVSIHAPARGATCSYLSRSTCEHVSIHAPARGATLPSETDRKALAFQSTPLREGRPPCCSGAYSRSVSIHAPARGATFISFSFFSCAVSIHAPARGATHDTGQLTEIIIVSIHAPARGATTYLAKIGLNSQVSIHAPARGATYG